jgi:hypothetical protein
LPIADCSFPAPIEPIGNWQSAIGNEMADKRRTVTFVERPWMRLKR